MYLFDAHSSIEIRFPSDVVVTFVQIHSVMFLHIGKIAWQYVSLNVSLSLNNM